MTFVGFYDIDDIHYVHLRTSRFYIPVGWSYVLKVWVSADVVFPLTVSVLSSSYIPFAPSPCLSKGLDRPFAVFGPVERPDFVIDESELPY